MSRLTFLILFIFLLSLGKSGQNSPINEEFLRRLEQFAVAAKKQLADKPIPDMSHWRLQRIETISTLKELRSKLDNACFYISWANVADSTMSIFCKLAYLAEIVMKFLHSALSEMDISSFMCPAAYFTTQASSIMELVLSPDFQYNLQTVFRKDREISRSFNEWLQSSLELEREVGKIFSFDLKSQNSIYFVLLYEFNILLILTKNPKEALDLMKLGKHSKFLNMDSYIDDLLLFSIHYSIASKTSPLVSEKIQLSLSILNTLISAIKSDFEVYRNFREEKMSIMISFVRDNIGIKISRAVKSSNYISLEILDIAKDVTSFRNARNIFKDGSCQHSDILKYIIDILELELTFMESSFSI